MRYGFSRLILALVLVLAAPGGVRPADGGPEAVVGRLHEALLGVMHEGAALDFQARYQRLAGALESVFDFPLMTRIAVGGAWAEASEEQRARLIAAFRAMSIATYARRFDSFAGERFDVLDRRELGAGDVIVATRLDPGSGETPVALDYRVYQGQAGWRIVDVFLTGTVSELAIRRAEFSAVVRDHGLDGLIAALEAKALP
ncbi:MAG: ABC transporter substrate-binding protein [Alphaproteobacteria bacterium]